MVFVILKNMNNVSFEQKYYKLLKRTQNSQEPHTRAFC